MKILANLDLVKNQLLNAIAQNVATDPTEGLVEGWVIYNTTDHVFKYYNGTAWVPLTEAATVTVETSINDQSTNDNPVGPAAVYDFTTDPANWSTGTDGQVLVVDGTSVTGVSIDSTPSEDSTNLVTSGGVKAAIDAVTFDPTGTARDGQVMAVSVTTDPETSEETKTVVGKSIDESPIADSNNLITSGGVKAAIDAIDPTGGVANGQLLTSVVTTDPDSGEVTSRTVAGTVIDQTVDANGTGVPTTAAVAAAVAAIQSMEFIGTVGSDGTVTSADTDIDGQVLMDLTNFKKGWTFVVSGTLPAATSGFAQTLNAGDMIITLANDPAFTVSNFSLVVKNMDGVVMGPSSATNGNIALFDGATGTLIKDSGYQLSALTITVQVDNPTLTSESGVCTWTIQHNQNNRNIDVTVFDANWEKVLPDIVLPDTNNLQIKITSATDISPNAYHAIIQASGPWTA